jgi:hypothetical protein
MEVSEKQILTYLCWWSNFKSLTSLMSTPSICSNTWLRLMTLTIYYTTTNKILDFYIVENSSLRWRVPLIINSFQALSLFNIGLGFFPKHENKKRNIMHTHDKRHIQFLYHTRRVSGNFGKCLCQQKRNAYAHTL